MKMAWGHQMRACAVLVLCVCAILASYGIGPSSALSLKALQRFERPGRSLVENVKVDRFEGFESHLELVAGKESVAEVKECEESYGFLPCSTSIGGNLFLLLAYGFLLLKAAQCLSEGSELLLAVLDPGLVGELMLSDGSPNPEVVKRLFSHFDDDNNENLSEKELRALILGIRFEHDRTVPSEAVVNSWMSEFDLSKDRQISEKEFIDGMSKWLTHVMKTKKGGDNVPHYVWWNSEQQDARNALAHLDDSNGDDEDEDEEELSNTYIVTKAILLIAFGAAVAGVFADPLVSAITNFSTAANISPFFISFVATPLATNSSEAISSILFAKSKKKRNISMTYSQVYGGVTMNNTLCLGIFLAVVYVRGLVWDFSSEVAVILFSTCVIGAMASFRTTFPLWTGLVALALYPISIGLVALLDSVFGWQ